MIYIPIYVNRIFHMVMNTKKNLEEIMYQYLNTKLEK